MTRSINTAGMLEYLFNNPIGFYKAKEKINYIFSNVKYNNKARYQRILEIADVIYSKISGKASISLEELSKLSNKTTSAVTDAVREMYFHSLDSKTRKKYSAGYRSKYGKNKKSPHTIPTAKRKISKMVRYKSYNYF